MLFVFTILQELAARATKKLNKHSLCFSHTEAFADNKNGFNLFIQFMQINNS